ncbi:phosphoribosyl-AMP cyclohydrolase [Maritalea mediterranea]|uniref:phosphoribosyl-AMP cyclohydrolase n=1 Tax=Maritalea mediterranea TaxID=2909667 RepID=A0ABS9E769_9HYPH|nr:phosphoribosyl-AMP cyclohydrolase [Maritalea mediterranea]MCF4098725.1 phosphoribosyl-AMP cyclohydrolase [Maritalea mediterranea]
MSKMTDPKSLSKTELETGPAFAPRLDANGLILAVVTDAESDALLMAAYMNEEALNLTFETGYVHFFSRSRNSLWKKGESSGELLEFVEMRVDCDQDILQVRATPAGAGATCHTGRKTCFYRTVEKTADGYVVDNLGIDPLFDPAEKYK